MVTKKRFIAGATCPQCQQQDSIMLYAQSGVEVMECVECGHQRRQGSAPAQQQAGSGEVIGLFKPE
ncbi:YheV family putative zinc ribbon protein [Ferrimonas pelagia]|uniref:YheV family putative zinc ribbon protein n=1 Tax=Ferrimonas pelagia TaxID=1177826 RepID=A0ABP9ES53_9GAMM